MWPNTGIPAPAPTPTDLKLKKVMLLSLIGWFSLTALVAVLFLVFGSFGKVQARILATTASIGWFSLIGLCGAIWYDRGERLALSYGTIAAAVVAAMYTLPVIWELFDFSFDWVVKPMIVLYTVAVTLAHASLVMLSFGRNTVVRASVIGTISLAGLLATIIVGVTLLEPDLGDGFFRFTGALAVLAVLGTIVTPLLKKAVSIGTP